MNSLIDYKKNKAILEQISSDEIYKYIKDEIINKFSKITEKVKSDERFINYNEQDILFGFINAVNSLYFAVRDSCVEQITDDKNEVLKNFDHSYLVGLASEFNLSEIEERINDIKSNGGYGTMNVNVKKQVNEMEQLLDLSDEPDIIREFIDKIQKLKFKRDYLKKNISENEISQAQKTIKEIQDLQKNLSELEKKLTKKEQLKNVLKKPFLFGKSNYLKEFNNLSKEISEIEKSILETKHNIDIKKNDFESSKSILKKSDTEDNDIELQYNEDETIFLKAKKNIVDNIAQKICSFPNDFIEQSWEESLPFFKDFFRSDPTKNLFPIIGWKHAYTIARILHLDISKWMESKEAIIIDSKSEKISDLFEDFLYSFVTNDTSYNDDVFFNIIKAESLYNRIITIKEMKSLNGLKNEMDTERFAIMANTMLTKVNPALGNAIKECFLSIEKAKSIALKDNNEEILNIILSSEEFMKNRIGFVKKVF